jgi:hypothetical protein
MITLATILCLAIIEAVPAFRPVFHRKPIDDIVARCGNTRPALVSSCL